MRRFCYCAAILILYRSSNWAIDARSV